MAEVTGSNGKYVIMKDEDFWQFLSKVALPPYTAPDGTFVGMEWDCAAITEDLKREVAERAIVDAWVLRPADMFAGTAMHSYKDAVLNAIAVLEEVGAPVPEDLLVMRDVVHGRANEFDSVATKRVPD